MRPVHSQAQWVGDERIEQSGRDETIPVLAWLDDGVKLNYNKLGKVLAHMYPLPTGIMKSHLEH